jgi:hypothetical protein
MGQGIVKMGPESSNKNFKDVGLFLFILVALTAALLIFIIPWIKSLLG